MRAPAKLFAILLLFVLCNARASTTTSEITDTWWNPAESGWGVNIILQNSVVFATFFVYDANRNPVWYTAPRYGQSSAFVWSAVCHQWALIRRAFSTGSYDDKPSGNGDVLYASPEPSHSDVLGRGRVGY
jgi:hypothetical protein